MAGGGDGCDSIFDWRACVTSAPIHILCVSMIHCLPVHLHLWMLMIGLLIWRHVDLVDVEIFRFYCLSRYRMIHGVKSGPYLDAATLLAFPTAFRQSL